MRTPTDDRGRSPHLRDESHAYPGRLPLGIDEEAAHRLFEKLLPSEVKVVCSRLGRGEHELHPLEAAVVAGAAPRRKIEFAAGRYCARQALALLGHATEYLEMGRNRAPVWPEGLVGSITHTRDLCAAAVAERKAVLGLGIDVEMLGRIDESLTSLIVTDAELRAITTASLQSCPDWRTIVFSAKESVLKCVLSAGGQSRRFDQIQVFFDLSSHSFAAELRSDDRSNWQDGCEIPGRWAMDERRVYTSSSLGADEAASLTLFR